MHRFPVKLKSLIPVVILALLVAGCTRNRPEPTGTLAPTSDQVTNGQPAQDGSPTTIAIQPTATPTSTPVTIGPGTTPEVTGDGNGTSLTPSPEPSPTPEPTVTPIKSVPSPGGGPSGDVIHIVQPGENLFRIGLKYNIDANTLARYNGIHNPNQIYAGQRLQIPVSGGRYPGEGHPGAGRTYIVQPGDTLTSIAYKFGVTVHALMAANNLSNADVIYSGQKLLIP